MTDKTIDSREEQREKADLSILVTESGNDILCKAVHSLNTQLSILVMNLGIIIEVIDEQRENAKLSILLTESGIITSVSFEHPLNADSSILQIDSGIITELSKVQFVNALSPIIFTELGMENSFMSCLGGKHIITDKSLLNNVPLTSE